MNDKQQLLFVCGWGNDRKKSWSGTHYGIYLALQKYFELEDVDIGNCNGDFYNVLYKFLNKFKKLFGFRADMDLTRLKHYRKKLQHKYNKGSYVSLQFGECPKQNNIKSYFYQDFSVSAVKFFHDNRPELFPYCVFSNAPYSSILKREKFQTEAFKQAAGIFCMGEWYRKFLIDSGIPKDKVHAVGAGINLDATKIDTSKKTGNKILFVGRDFERKNGPLVIAAFKLAKRQRSDIELYIAGPAPKEDIDGVYWLGDVPSQKLSDYFNLCDIFCMPSKFEAYGIVFIEALTYGLPCIGRNAFEMPYFIEDGKTGYILNEENADTLSQLMLKLLDNKEIKENVNARRQEYLEKYSWDAVAKRMYDVISNDMTKGN